MENYYTLNNAKTFNFTKAEWINIAKMSFEGSFLEEQQKQLYYAEIDLYAAKHNVKVENRSESSKNKVLEASFIQKLFNPIKSVACGCFH